MSCCVSLNIHIHTHTHTYAGYPPSHHAPVQLCPFGVWGQPRASGWPASPVTSGSETAYSSLGLEREGRPFGQAGFLWGFPYKEAKAAAKATPILTHQRSVSGVEGHYHAGVQELGHPVPKTVPLCLIGGGTQRDRGPGAGGLGEQGGSWTVAPQSVCSHNLQAPGISGGPIVDPKKEPGQRPCGRPKA